MGSAILFFAFLEFCGQLRSSKKLETKKQKSKAAYSMSGGFGLVGWFIGSAVSGFFDFLISQAFGNVCPCAKITGNKKSNQFKAARPISAGLES